MKAIIDNAPVGIVTIDEQGIIQTFNAAAGNMFGYTDSEVLGCNINLLMAEPHRSHHDDYLRRYLETGDSRVVGIEGRELEGVRKDGTTFPLHILLGETDMDGDRCFFGFIQDMTERKQQEERLLGLATIDPLTGLANLNALLTHMQQRIEAQEPFGLFLLDISRLKTVNETLSRAAGNEVLREVGRRLSTLEDRQCFIARVGGDDFAVLWPGLKVPKAYFAAVMELQTLLTGTVQLDLYSIDIEANVGVDMYPGDREDNGPEDIFRRAEVTLDAAKRLRSGFAFYDPDMEHYGVEHLSLLGDLNHAMENGELALYYQPKLDIRDGTVRGVEALVRWHHPDRGLISTELFIPIIEDTNLIHSFTAWGLNEAMRHASEWHERGLELSVSVNIAARSLMNSDIVTRIRDGLARWRLPPARLILEITETGLMVDPAIAKRNLNHIHELGVGLSIDDFGTGYSSLAYLKELPVDELKIDRTFIHHMLDNDKDANIVQAAIHLAHSLGLVVVAEGIENETMYRLLADFDCDKAQGYHLGRPMPFPDVERWIANHAGEKSARNPSEEGQYGQDTDR
jgi:PAS domain S-box-containing protein/diguanylate cyclase (GGDEF)-like protein